MTSAETHSIDDLAQAIGEDIVAGEVGEMRVNIGVDFDPYEWEVICVPVLADLARTLNEYSQSGWDIFEVKIDPKPIIVMRRQYKEPK